MQSTKTTTDIELLLFRYKEGLLGVKEAAKVRESLEQNDQWRELADLYDPSLKAPSYPTTLFADKESLRAIAISGNMTTNPHGGRKIVPYWRYVAVAASVALLIAVGIGVLMPRQTQPTLIIARNIPLSELFTDKQSSENESFAKPMTVPTPISKREARQRTERMVAESLTETPTETPTEPQTEMTAHPTVQTIIMTDNLITYLDDDDYYPSGITEQREIIETDQLITYIDPAPEEKETSELMATREKPSFLYAIEDFWNGLRLTRMRHQTDILNQLAYNNNN